MGKLVGIAVRPARKAPMVELSSVRISKDSGLAGDHAGKRLRRLVTVIEREGWEAACRELTPPEDPVSGLPWTTRRANLLVENARVPKSRGGVFRIGEVLLEITGQANPCGRMEEARPGLLKALGPDWRGGVTCSVLEAGVISLGDNIETLFAPTVTARKLP